MIYISRTIEQNISPILARGKSILLLGARQTGKTTLLRQIKSDLAISLVRPDMRLRYEKTPSILTQEVEAIRKKGSIPLILLDEVQKVPALLDAVQDLIDRGVAQFILTGSSARKLRKGSDINLLPGRVVALKLDPFSFAEFQEQKVEDVLLYGSLPGMALVDNKENREEDLEAYVLTYLEEEVRAEAIVRSLGSFAKFLEYAAAESGSIMNFRKLSQEIGVAHTTIAAYFQILQDCLIIERIDPVTKSSTRKKLTKSSKYLFFDLGVRRLAAKEGTSLPRETMGRLFEQLVGLEILRMNRFIKQSYLKFWRDPNGPEVDWVIERPNQYIPVEVKWTEAPALKDTKGLQTFLKEYPSAKEAYVICRTPRPVKLAPNIWGLSLGDFLKILKGK